MYLRTQQQNAISALELMRQLGVFYPTVWKVKRKRLQAMLERDSEATLTGVIEIDDVYWVGECLGQKPGCGSPNRPPSFAPAAKPLAAARCVVKGFRRSELAVRTKQLLDPACVVFSDGVACFHAIAAGLEHQPLVTGGGAGSVRIKTWAVSTKLKRVRQDGVTPTIRS